MTVEQIEQRLTVAIEDLRTGNLARAEQSLRQVLAVQPEQPDALHYLGVAALQQSNPAAAVELIHRSIQLAPNFAAFNNLAAALRMLNRIDDAIACYDRSIQLNPNHPDALMNIGTLLMQRKQYEIAARAFERLASLIPNHPHANFLLATSLAELNYLERAAAAFRAHLKVVPDNAETLGRLSTVLSKLNRHTDAESFARRAVEVAPNLAEAHNNLGWILDRAGNPTEAEACYRRAIELQPTMVMALGNLAALLEKSDRFDESLSMFQRAAAADPKHVEALCALAGSYSRAGRYEEAMKSAEQALAVEPHLPAARGHRALSVLAQGRYEEGFAEYEWRWKCKDFTTAPRDFEQPQWRGGDPSGRTILIHCEQGFGDNIQFARYIPMLAARGAKIILECPHALRRLMEQVEGVTKVIAAGLRPPPFDLHAPLLSLPHAFKTSLQSVPANVPYFRIPDDAVSKWRDRLSPHLSRVNIGLLWRGNNKPNPKRSIPLNDLAPLVRNDVTFVSLQVGEQGAEANNPPAGMKLVDLRKELTDFLDTAAVMQLLDLVITIDTGGAHLAGALGKPVWTMLIHAADWRWLQRRVDSPWYPTMKLFRQETPDDWSPVITRVNAELDRHIS